MMNKVYLLQHSYHYGENNEYEETKIIGIFDSKNKAQDKIKEYIKLPWFKDFTEVCFSIDEYHLNVGEWSEGFAEWWYN